MKIKHGGCKKHGKAALRRCGSLELELDFLPFLFGFSEKTATAGIRIDPCYKLGLFVVKFPVFGT